jgi:hypothetical protein
MVPPQWQHRRAAASSGFPQCGQALIFGGADAGSNTAIRIPSGPSKNPSAKPAPPLACTVKIHVTAIFKSLGVKNRTQAVIAAAELERTQVGAES